MEGIRRLEEFVVQPSFGDSFGRLSDELPDSLEHHCVLCVVIPDLVRLPVQLLQHGGHLGVQVGVLRVDPIELLLRQVEFLPVRPVCQLPEYVSGAAVVEGLVHSPGDVLQPVVLQLEAVQVRIHPLEGVFRKRPRG